jgi:hypothetical protein
VVAVLDAEYVVPEITIEAAVPVLTAGTTTVYELPGTTVILFL